MSIDELFVATIKEAVLHGRENAGKDIDYPVSARAFLLKAALLELLLAEAESYWLHKHPKEPSQEKWPLKAVPVERLKELFK